MPRYDYECETCHHQFELKQSFTSEPVADCPRCQHSARRLFHSVPIVFKGSGWYVNDYGKRASSSTSDSDSKEPSDSGDKSKAKSDSAVKTESKAKAESKANPKAESASAKTKGD